MMRTDYQSQTMSQPPRSHVGRNVIWCAGVAAALLVAQTAWARAAVGTNAAVSAPVQLDVIAQDLAQSAAEASRAPATTSPAAQDPSGKTAPADSANKEETGGKDTTTKDVAAPVSAKAATGKSPPAPTAAVKDPGRSAAPKAAAPRSARLAPADPIQRTIRRETAAATQRLLYWRSIYRARYRTANYEVARARRDGSPGWLGRHFVLMLGVGY